MRSTSTSPKTVVSPRLCPLSALGRGTRSTSVTSAIRGSPTARSSRCSCRSRRNSSRASTCNCSSSSPWLRAPACSLSSQLSTASKRSREPMNAPEVLTSQATAAILASMSGSPMLPPAGDLGLERGDVGVRGAVELLACHAVALQRGTDPGDVLLAQRHRLGPATGRICQCRALVRLTSGAPATGLAALAPQREQHPVQQRQFGCSPTVFHHHDDTSFCRQITYRRVFQNAHVKHGMKVGAPALKEQCSEDQAREVDGRDDVTASLQESRTQVTWCGAVPHSQATGIT